MASDVDAVLHDKLLHKARVGIEVIKLGASADQAREVFAAEPTTPFIPASNLKVVTTSAALDRLGAEFKFRTLLAKRGDDLILIGDGDPTFGDLEMLRKVNWKITTVYEGWAAQLQKMGVAQVKDVLVDDSVFDEVFFHPRWPANQYNYKYMAEVGGMSLNTNLLDILVQPTAPGSPAAIGLDPPTRFATIQGNCVTGRENAITIERQQGANVITVGGQTPSRGTARVSATIHDPPMYAGTVLAETVAAAGVKIGGSIKRDRTLRAELAKRDPKSAGQWQIVGIHETPLMSVIARANKDSVNLYAESLCKRIGFESTKTSGTWESGSLATGEFLKKVGVAPEEFKLDDGSGLSRGNQVSPRALVRVLAYNFYGPNRQAYIDALSVAGVDGTLEDRFRGSDLRKRVYGKSGFIEGVSTLCGLVHAKDGGWYAFSVMMNGIPRGSNSEVKLLQERIVKLIDAEIAK